MNTVWRFLEDWQIVVLIGFATGVWLRRLVVRRRHARDPLIDEAIRPPRLTHGALGQIDEQIRIEAEERRRRAALTAQASLRIASGGRPRSAGNEWMRQVK